MSKIAGKIKGITIEIAGNTQPLNKALEDVNKKTRDVQSELRQVERLLKLDPKNTDLLAQRQKLLADAVGNSKEKLDRLRQAQEQVNTQFAKGEISEEQYRHFQRQVINAEQELSKFEKQLKETGLTAEQVGQKLKDAGQKMTDIGKDLSMKVTAPLVAAGAASFKFAADLQDAMGASEQIFKGAAAGVENWADNLASYYGIAETEALTYANTMGAMLQNIGGLTEEEAAKQAQILVELAGDLTAMFGGTTESAIQALTGALKGNNSMLDNYGMGVNDATIKTKALEMGLYDGKGALELSAKQAATLALIMEQTADAQGQAAREAEGASGGMRAFATEVKNLATDLGEILLPVITPMISSLRDAIGAFKELSPGTQKAVVAIAGIAAAIGPVIVIIGTLISSIGSIITFFAAGGVGATAFGAVVGALTGPIGIAIAAIAALVVAGVLLYKNWDKVKAYTIQAWSSIKVAVLKVISSIMGAMETLYGWIPKIGGAVKASAAAARQALEEETRNMEKAKEGWYKANSAGTSGAGFRQLEEESKQSMEGVQTSIDDTIPSFDDLGASVSDAGGKATKAAEDTRAEWEKTADVLGTRLQLIQTQQENAALAAGKHGDEVKGLAEKIVWLNKQHEIQSQIIEAVNDGYQESVEAKGQDAEETLKLALRLEQEKKAQAEIEKQIRETTQSIKDQSQQLRDLAEEVTKVEKKYKDDLAAALDDYQRKVEETNRKVADEERKLTEQYQSEIDKRAKSLRDFVGLFDEVTSKEVSGETLLDNLRGQVSAFEDWSKNIEELAARGVDKGLIEELREMGPKAGPEIAALNTLTDEQLSEYVVLWKRKNQDAREEAITQLRQQRIEMEQKLIEIRNDATEQLELYKKEWEEKNAEIRKNAEDEMKRIEEKFQSIAKAGTTYGVELVANFTSGMESQFDSLRETLFEMASIVDSYMPHSPAKRGPLSKIMEWGPSLVGALADGIKISLPKLENAVTGMAALTPAAIGAISSNTSNNYGGNVFHINVGAGSTREQAEGIMRELHRLGVRF